MNGEKIKGIKFYGLSNVSLNVISPLVLFTCFKEVGKIHCLDLISSIHPTEKDIGITGLKGVLILDNFPSLRSLVYMPMSLKTLSR